MTPNKRVLFVCLGNICRSPAAEGVLATQIESRGLASTLSVDSAGTASYHVGEPADKRMRSAAAKRGINLTSRARAIHSRDLDEFHLIVVMDHSNMRDVTALTKEPSKNVKLFSEFLNDSDFPEEVPDPYYGDGDGFEYVLDMLESGCPQIIDHLLDSTH